MGTVSQTQEPFIRLLGCSWADLGWRIVCHLTLPEPGVFVRGASSPLPTFSHLDTPESSAQRGKAVGKASQEQGARCSLPLDWGISPRVPTSPTRAAPPRRPATPPPPHHLPPRGTCCLFPLIFHFLFGWFGVSLGFSRFVSSSRRNGASASALTHF